MHDQRQTHFLKAMLKRIFPIVYLFCLLFFGVNCTKQGHTQSESGTTKPETTTQTDSAIAPVSDDLQYSKWTPELNIPDPVSISFDDQGRAYVTQTQRRKSQDLDIRRNTDWVPDDVGLETVEDKRNFLRTQLSPENSASNTERVADHNGDGSHDWKDLMVLPEIIHLVEDSDGDGFADSSKIYDDDFKTEVTGIGAGVLWHEGDVYATVAPDVWKLRDTDGDDRPDLREVMAHGFGMHIAYAGHDMHGLIVGPDGKIYWSIGDKGVSVISKEGKRFHYPNQGAMLRCNPDGSDFEVFAHGLRNVQEPVFDAYGNWFGVDNDSDQVGEKERFVYIVNGMDAGWRCNYQYRGDGYNPWMEEGMTIPKHEGQAAYFIPTISNYIDGPAGFTWNPGTALNDRYKNYFFLNGTLNGAQYAFQVEPDGASFKMVDDHKLGAGLPLIGLTFGPDGALYSVDWGGDYPLNQKGAIWKLDAPGAYDAERQEVQELIAEGVGQKSTNELGRLLGHADQRIRLKAQFELVKREDIQSLLTSSGSNHQLTRVHAIWGLGQLARRNDQSAIDQLIHLLQDSDPEIQVQASKVLADLEPGRFDGKLLIPHLSSNQPRVRFQAGLSIGRQKVAEAFDTVVQLIETNNGEDRYLRHAGIAALEGIGKADTLLNHPSAEVRLCAVVVLRRLANPIVAKFLEDISELVVLEAARAIHDDFSIEEALPDLANKLVFTESKDEALLRRIINANFRLGTVNHAYQVAEFAANSNRPIEMRLDALDALANWITPPLLDRVDGRRRYLGTRSAPKIAKSIRSILEELLSSEDSAIIEKAVAAAQHLKVSLGTESLEKLFRNRQAPDSLRVLAFESLKSQRTVTYAMNSPKEALRMAAAAFLSETNKEMAFNYLQTRMERSPSNTEKQQVISLLSTFETESADAILRTLAKDLSEGNVAAALHLDIIEAATKRNMTSELTDFEIRRPKGPLSNFAESIFGGNAQAGEKVIKTHLAAQCARCHKFGNKDGSEIGPRIKNIGSQKDREYLLRALVDPGADIADGYGLTSVTLKSGETISGQLLEENETGLKVKLADGTTQNISRQDLVSFADPLSTMPPMGFILTKRELRDVVEYLASMK